MYYFFPGKAILFDVEDEFSMLSIVTQDRDVLTYPEDLRDCGTIHSPRNKSDMQTMMAVADECVSARIDGDESEIDE